MVKMKHQKVLLWAWGDGSFSTVPAAQASGPQLGSTTPKARPGACL